MAIVREREMSYQEFLESKRMTVGSFGVDIPPSLGRPRFARMGKFVKIYDPAESRQHKDNIAAQIVTQWPRLHERGEPLLLTLTFFLPRPTGHYRRNGGYKQSCLQDRSGQARK